MVEDLRRGEKWLSAMVLIRCQNGISNPVGKQIYVLIFMRQPERYGLGSLLRFTTDLLFYCAYLSAKASIITSIMGAAGCQCCRMAEIAENGEE